jgi:hypothetical protein
MVARLGSLGESEVGDILAPIWQDRQFEQNAGPSTSLRSAQDDTFVL